MLTVSAQPTTNDAGVSGIWDDIQNVLNKGKTVSEDVSKAIKDATGAGGSDPASSSDSGNANPYPAETQDAGPNYTAIAIGAVVVGGLGYYFGGAKYAIGGAVAAGAVTYFATK